MPTKFIKLTLLLLGICVLSAAPVFADQTFTFTFTSTLGNLGHSATFRSGPLLLPVTGWNRNFTSGNLFAKNLGDTESGLGLFGFTDNELVSTTPLPFIQLDVAALIASAETETSRLTPLRTVRRFTLILSSLQLGDSYCIRGGNAVGTLGTAIIACGLTSRFFIIERPRAFRNFNISASSGTVLLGGAEVVTTPEPSSAGLLLIGLGVLIAAGTLGKKLLA